MTSDLTRHTQQLSYQNDGLTTRKPSQQSQVGDLTRCTKQLLYQTDNFDSSLVLGELQWSCPPLHKPLRDLKHSSKNNPETNLGGENETAFTVHPSHSLWRNKSHFNDTPSLANGQH